MIREHWGLPDEEPVQLLSNVLSIYPILTLGIKINRNLDAERYGLSKRIRGS